MNCAVSQLLLAAETDINAAITASAFSGIPVYRNKVEPIGTARFVTFYRTPADNEFFSQMLSDTCYALTLDIKCRGNNDIEAENILATVINGLTIDTSQTWDLTSAIEVMGTYAEYENQGATPVYLTIGRVVLKYMLNNDDQFDLI